MTLRMSSVTSWVLIFKCNLVETKLLRWVGMQRAVPAGWLHPQHPEEMFLHLEHGYKTVVSPQQAEPVVC